MSSAGASTEAAGKMVELLVEAGMVAVAGTVGAARMVVGMLVVATAAAGTVVGTLVGAMAEALRVVAAAVAAEEETAPSEAAPLY